MNDTLTINGGAPISLTQDRYVLGRSDECDLLVPESDSGTSRRHAVLERDEHGSWSIVDLASRNGTFIDGTRIRDRQKLLSGNEILIGTTRFRIAFADPEIAIGAPVPPPRTAATSASIDLPASIAQKTLESDPVVALSGQPLLAPVDSVEDTASATTSADFQVSANPPPIQPTPAIVAPPIQPMPSRVAIENRGTDTSGVWKGLVGINSALMMLSLFLPWFEVHLGIFGGAGSYSRILQLFFEVMKDQSNAISAEPRILLILLPALGTLLCLGGLSRSSQTRGFMLLLGGTCGLASSIYVYNLSTGNLIDASRLLGAGFMIYGFTSFAALIIGIVSFATAKERVSP